MAKAVPLALIALVIALAGCGGGGGSTSTSAATNTQAAATPSTTPASGGSSGGGQTLKLAADPSGQLKFDKTSLSAKAGKVSIDFTNSSSVAHDVTVQPSNGGANLGATPQFAGGSKTLSLNLKPGTYTFFCSVPGHEQAGMKGTLTVK